MMIRQHKNVLMTLKAERCPKHSCFAKVVPDCLQMTSAIELLHRDEKTSVRVTASKILVLNARSGTEPRNPNFFCGLDI